MFGPQARLELARRLASELSEAAHRAAVHQAYCAAYHHCAAKLGRNPANRDDAGHGRLRDDLLSELGRDPWLLRAKDNIGRLLLLRAWADYDDARPMLQAHAREAIQRASLILS
jgi:hypothetical protein